MVALRNILLGTGIAAVGAVGTKLAVDYFRNRDKEDPVPESAGDQEPASDEEIAYVTVEPNSVQEFLDKSFGDPGRYVPTRAPKVFEYLGKQYMVIWARDNTKNKNQMLAFVYEDNQRKMVASVGYTAQASDYNVNLENTPLAVEIGSQRIQSGKGEAAGTDEVDIVPA
ncbi:MAG: hypothetical protein VKK04_08095 [Synechococcales bacterium]|nr:hypothetical protein [Synechococcales bacterium]